MLLPFEQNKFAGYGQAMRGFRMRKSIGLVAVVLTFTIAGACSPKEKNETRATAEDIENKTKEVASDAGEKAKEVAGDVADKGKQILTKTGEVITDSWITTKLKAKFADEKLLKDSDITIETKDRVVTLKGTVRAVDGKRQAVSIANGTDGVLRVVDELAVKKK